MRKKPSEWPESIQTVLDETSPVPLRARRLPLFLWPAILSDTLNEERTEALVGLLYERGVGLVASWNHNDAERTLSQALSVARAQKRLGLRVHVNASALLQGFFDGSEATAHIDADGNPFFDDTFGREEMGCPFRLEERIAPMRRRITDFADAYTEAGVPLDFVCADWEIDGPLEWNRAHEASKRCVVCRSHLPAIDDFPGYQRVLRAERSRLQREVFAEPIRQRFPGALVGNYAVYPHNGLRYWYDYFEYYVEGQPAVDDQDAHYRRWADEFPGTHYTVAMPVYYPWSWTWNWYDFEAGDYRWFYNELLIASNAGRSTSPGVPIVAFVHWHTVDVGKSCVEGKEGTGLDDARQMSEWAYRELLWHALLRGTDTFFLWCATSENAKEVRLLHEVWAAAQEFDDFLEQGTPITFDVPPRPGPVVSGVLLDGKVLVRRTDFTGDDQPVALEVSGRTIRVSPGESGCRIMELDPPGADF